MARTNNMLLIGIPIILVIIFVIVPVLYCTRYLHSGLLVWRFIGSMARHKEQGQVRLLCQTDHQALLNACRELSRRVAAGEMKPGTYYIRSNPRPEVAGFPHSILDLQPSAVVIDNDGRVEVAMMGGLDHFGVFAYPEDYKQPPFVGFKLGDRELLPGLWYYDDGYEGNPGYDKKIDGLLQKRKQAR